jgi:hypothetical protein
MGLEAPLEAALTRLFAPPELGLPLVLGEPRVKINLQPSAHGVTPGAEKRLPPTVSAPLLD